MHVAAPTFGCFSRKPLGGDSVTIPTSATQLNHDIFADGRNIIGYMLAQESLPDGSTTGLGFQDAWKNLIADAKQWAKENPITAANKTS